MCGYIADVGRVYEDYAKRPLTWRDGQMAVYLEIFATIKALEDEVVGGSLLALNKEEVISVLQTLIDNSGLPVEEVYEQLWAVRRLTFVAEPYRSDADDASSADSE
jgi:hypothetical protein